MSDHPDIELLPDVLEGIPVKESIRQLFRDPANGTPDNISRAGCLALACLSNSFLALINHQAVNREILWNTWRKAFPVTGSVGNWQNSIDFSCHVDDGKNYPFFIDFSNFEFGDGANFNRSKWPLSVNFKKCKWGNYCDLSRVEWGDRGDFLFAEWGECCNFNFSKWGSNTNFSQTRWGIFCTFIGSTWGDRCRFISSQWSKNCNFLGSSWGDDANFNGAKWGQGAYFVSAQWRGSAYLEGTQWGRDFNFNGACWFGKVNFGGVDLKTLRHLFQDQKQFDKAKDWSEQHVGQSNIFFNIDFSGARFLGDTDFSNRQFKESSIFGTLQSTPKKLTPLVNDAGERLRVKRDLTLRETGLKRWLFKAYKTFSDFGFSITRPLKYGGLGVLRLTAVYGILSWLGQCGLNVHACQFAPQWLEFSLLQTLPLPGLDKLSEAASKVFWPEGSWWSLGLSVLVIFHKILSLATLFLVGLALRNLFKLK